MRNWSDRLTVLADALGVAGKLVSPEWRRAFCAIPRHELVPDIYLQDERRRWRRSDLDTEQQWDLVYSDTTLITRTLPNLRGVEIPVSSSTKPGLMLRMLEVLDVADGMRVLEIGTGTGYNAALLSERLGAHNVFSVDVRPELVDAARGRLARLGHHPTLVTGDGAEGLPEHAPFDRIIVTCGMPSIPVDWITQLAPGGLLLVDLEGPLSAGNLIALRRHSTAAELNGQFLTWFGRFMPVRSDTTGAEYHLAAPAADGTAPIADSWSSVDPAVLDREFRLLAQVHLPGGTFHTLTAVPDADRPTHTRLVSPDGSWCEVERTPTGVEGHYQVRQAGPMHLWHIVELAYAEWRQLEEPEWSRFGVTVTPRTAHLWLDEPMAPSAHWPLWTPGPARA